MNPTVTKEKISHAYNKHVSPKLATVQKASKHTLKEALQVVSEFIPYLQLYEIYKGKTLISGLPISNKFQKTGRKLQIIPQTGGLYSFIFDGQQIFTQAKTDIMELFLDQKIPDYISLEIGLVMIWLIVGHGIYLGITKPGDLAAYKKTYFAKNINSLPDLNQQPLPHDTEE